MEIELQMCTSAIARYIQVQGKGRDEKRRGIQQSIQIRRLSEGETGKSGTLSIFSIVTSNNGRRKNTLKMFWSLGSVIFGTKYSRMDQVKHRLHKIVLIWSFYRLCFPAFGLYTEN